MVLFFFFKQKTAYEMRISDWSSDVCSSDLREPVDEAILAPEHDRRPRDRRGGEGRAHRRLAQSFRPAISRPRFAIGADRREMHQCPAPGGGTGFGDMPRAFDMERLKIAIQHPDQVDHRIRAGDGTRKTVGDRKSTRLNSSH